MIFFHRAIKKLKIPALGSLLLAGLFLFSACDSFSSALQPLAPGHLRVHYIDVGQGDCILLQTDQAALLIDGGSSKYGSMVTDYIKLQGINELDAVIGTHPHEDHIGGLIAVLNTLPVKNVYIPNISHTSKTFEDFVAAINASGAKRIQAKAGVKLDLEDLHGEFLGPAGAYEGDLNNNSAVFKLTHETIVFLFTGDAEAEAEADLIRQGRLEAHILKVAHHGSRSSCTEGFLRAVSPQYAIVSCGKDNSYGHPHEETINRLSWYGVGIYRTDEQGAIIFESDGNKLTANKAPWRTR